MEFSEHNLNELKKHEGLRLRAYDDLQPHLDIEPGDPILGTLTIGWGTTKNVYAGQVITVREAENLLREDIRKTEEYVNHTFSDFNMNQNEYDALVIFIYNLGVFQLEGSNTMAAIRNYFRAKDRLSFWWMKWVNSKGQVLPGLTKRRRDELKIFLNAD